MRRSAAIMIALFCWAGCLAGDAAAQTNTASQKPQDPATQSARPAANGAASATGMVVINSQQVAETLLGGTVTVRVSEAAGQEVQPRVTAAQKATGVTIASGVSLGEGRIVTYVKIPEQAKIRVTLPRDGQSLEAQVRVVDEYSGLSLLQIANKKDLPKIELASDVPRVGSPLFTAAGSGIEDPSVSFGILSGDNRTLGNILPPLLQCDMRATSSSSGAAVVNAAGKLVGVVVSTDSPNARAGWTYAMPARYAQRLLKNAPKQESDKMVVLKHRRPVLGMTLLTVGSENNTAVKVTRISENGPAHKAGLQVGDMIVEAEGIKVRSVYQATSMALRREPGDEMSFVVQRGEDTQRVDITLGGGGPLPVVTSRVRKIDNVGTGTVRVIPLGPSRVRVFQARVDGTEDADSSDPASNVEDKAAATYNASQKALLQRQLKAWALAIQRMQKQLKDRDDTIRKLEHKIELLEKQLEAQRTPGK